MKFKAAVISILVVLVAMVAYFGTDSQEKKTAYIQNSKVYNEFDLTKELDAELKEYSAKYTSVLDSLDLKLKVLASNIEKTGDSTQVQLFLATKQEYTLREQEYYNSYEQLSLKYHEQITTQMNEYIKEFGENNEYTYLFGANGTGTMMYASEGEDVSDEVIQFINSKYQGEG